MADNSAIKTRKVKINRSAAVIGSSAAAMHSALGLAKFGHKVTLITSNNSLGERDAAFPQMFSYIDSDSAIKENLANIINRIKDDSNIEILTSSVLESVDGEFGNFILSIKSGGEQKKLAAGAMILNYSNSYGNLDKLAEMVQSGNVPARIAIVLDVVKQQTRAVWGQVLSAAYILVERFGSEVTIYCQNARVAASGLESLYRKVREAGVIITKFDSKPKIIEQQSGVSIQTYDEVVGAEISKQFDLLITADTENGTNIAKALQQLRTGPNGELQYDDIWLLGGQTNCKGIFAIGDAKGNSDYRDALTDALAIAGEIGSLLSKAEIEIDEDAAVVDAEKCVLCLTCRRVCPHGAISIDSKNEAACVSLLSCMRCGACAAECPAGAIQLPRYNDEETRAKLGGKPSITIFACENSALPAAEAAKSCGLEPDSNINFINVPCAGKVDPKDILAALEKNAEKVMIIACHPESCQYLTGSSRARNRVKRINNILAKAGFDSERVVFRGISAVEPMKFIEYVKE